MIKQICSGGVGVPCYRTTQWVRLNFTEGKNNSLLKWRNRIGFKKSEMFFEINSILNRRWGPTWKQWGQTLHCRVRRKLAPRCHFSHPHLGGDAVLHCCWVEPCTKLCWHIKREIPNCVVTLEVINGCSAKLFCAIQRYEMLWYTAVPLYQLAQWYQTLWYTILRAWC